jgi:hypothetical protein
MKKVLIINLPDIKGTQAAKVLPNSAMHPACWKRSPKKSDRLRSKSLQWAGKYLLFFLERHPFLRTSSSRSGCRTTKIVF